MKAPKTHDAWCPMEGDSDRKPWFLLALGGAVWGGFLGIFGGALLGALYGLLVGDISLGLDGAILAGFSLSLAGAVFGVTWGWFERRYAAKRKRDEAQTLTHPGQDKARTAR